jgi:hypothetical protein
MKHNHLFLIIMSLFCSVASNSNTAYAQSGSPNPLTRPKMPSREALLPPPPMPPSTNKSANNEPAQAKSAQEEMTVKLQQLNADRVPMPLRLLLAPVYVSAILGDTAILRQPLPQTQQIGLVGAANSQLLGQNPQSGLNSGALPQTGASGFNNIPGGFGGAIPGGIGSIPPSFNTGAVPGVTPGVTPGVGTPGLSQPGVLGFGASQPPPRPTSIRVKNGEMINLHGFELLAEINRNQVTLLWVEKIDKPVIVYQSNIEPVNQGAYIPPSAFLERTDQQYFNRTQASSNSATVTGSSASSSSSGSGSR